MTTRPRSPQFSRSRRQEALFALALVAPGLVWFLVFNLYPALFSFWISLHHWAILGESTWAGLSNYARVFTDPINLIALRNILVYALLTVVGQLIIGLWLAILVNRKSWLSGFFRMVYYFPVIASWVVVSLIFSFLFNSEGLINYLLSDRLHLYGEHRAWLNDPVTALIAIATLGIWKGVGWVMLIYLAALQNVPKSLEEAARIDGASSGQVIRYVTVPLLRRATLFITVMLTIGAFQAFIQFYIMTGGGPNHQTEVPLSYMYNQGFTFLDFGYASALAFVLAILIIAISALQFRFLGQDQL